MPHVSARPSPSRSLVVPESKSDACHASSSSQTSSSSLVPSQSLSSSSQVSSDGQTPPLHSPQLPLTQICFPNSQTPTSLPQFCSRSSSTAPSQSSSLPL